jgi:alkylhydroperoxidase family enzyme
MVRLSLELMAWIKTIPFAEAESALQQILLEARAACPPEYGTPVPSASPVNESIVASHTLIPQALRHAFGTFTALMSPELPLNRRQHEMIATVVSGTNHCHY